MMHTRTLCASALLPTPAAGGRDSSTLSLEMGSLAKGKGVGGPPTAKLGGATWGRGLPDYTSPAPAADRCIVGGREGGLILPNRQPSTEGQGGRGEYLPRFQGFLTHPLAQEVCAGAPRSPTRTLPPSRGAQTEGNAGRENINNRASRAPPTPSGDGGEPATAGPAHSRTFPSLSNGCHAHPRA